MNLLREREREGKRGRERKRENLGTHNEFREQPFEVSSLLYLVTHVTLPPVSVLKLHGCTNSKRPVTGEEDLEQDIPPESEGS